VDGFAELERDRFCGADLHDVKGQAHAPPRLRNCGSRGHNHKKVYIRYYDRKTGLAVRTDSHTPEAFLPKSK
jgi:hypothetical protein